MMDDFENKGEYQLQCSFKSAKVIKILVFGDHLSGKTSFLSNFCEPLAKSKSKKTIGCDIFIMKKAISYEILSKQTEAKFSETFMFEFWELAGDKSQRASVNVYFQNQMQEFKGALFFFDCTNEKTFYNFHSWLKCLFDTKTGDNYYNCLWGLPFVLIGSKKDGLDKSKMVLQKKKVGNYMEKIFNCGNGENIIFLKKEYNENELDLKLFELFLNHLCIEFEMKSKEPTHNSEYLHNNEEAVKAKATHKYTLNSSVLMNRIKLSQLYPKDTSKTSSFMKINDRLDWGVKKLKNLLDCLLRKKDKEKISV